MRVRRHQELNLGGRASDDRSGQLVHGRDRFFALPARPEPQVGRDLIVARAARVQLTADGADKGAQPRLYVHVYVFFFAIPEELTALDFASNLLQTRNDRQRFAVAEHAGARQTFGVRERPCDVLAPQLPIDIDAGVEALHRGVNRVRQPTTSSIRHLLRSFVRSCVRCLP